jgi:hypothetical protein
VHEVRKLAVEQSSIPSGAVYLDDEPAIAFAGMFQGVAEFDLLSLIGKMLCSV